MLKATVAADNAECKEISDANPALKTSFLRSFIEVNNWSHLQQPLIFIHHLEPDLINTKYKVPMKSTLFNKAQWSGCLNFYGFNTVEFN